MADNIINIILCPAENQPVKIFFNINDSAQCLKFISGFDFIIYLFRKTGGKRLFLDSNKFIIHHVFTRECLYPWRHGSRKQKSPFLGIGMFHYLFHILNEPHIKHFISLIKDQIFDILEIECLSFDVVNNSSGCTNNNMHSFFKAPELLVDWLPTIDGNNLDTGIAL